MDPLGAYPGMISGPRAEGQWLGTLPGITVYADLLMHCGVYSRSCFLDPALAACALTAEVRDWRS